MLKYLNIKILKIPSPNKLYSRLRIFKLSFLNRSGSCQKIEINFKKSKKFEKITQN